MIPVPDAIPVRRLWLRTVKAGSECPSIRWVQPVSCEPCRSVKELRSVEREVEGTWVLLKVTILPLAVVASFFPSHASIERGTGISCMSLPAISYGVANRHDIFTPCSLRC